MTIALPSTIVRRSELTKAFENRELLLHYQPQVNISGRWPEIVGYEALARWPAAGDEFVSPDLFIPVAEESGLARYLDVWVIETVCRELGRLSANGARSRLTMSANVSPQNFQQPQFARSVADIVTRTRADPARLTLEITERAVLNEDKTTMKNICALSEIGVSLSLDDFGTGYSSLCYLKDIPIQEVKLDRSFISGLPHRRRDAAIVKATINLAAELGLQVVAEGVELARQAECLRGMGCHTIQGFLYGRPAARSDFMRQM